MTKQTRKHESIHESVAKQTHTYWLLHPSYGIRMAGAPWFHFSQFTLIVLIKICFTFKNVILSRNVLEYSLDFNMCTYRIPDHLLMRKLVNTYPLWSFSWIRWPSRLRNCWNAGLLCWLENNSSSFVWPNRWYRTPNLNWVTITCSSYAAINCEACGHNTGVRPETVSWSFKNCNRKGKQSTL